MENQTLLNILADEYAKIGHHDSSVTVRENNLSAIDRAAIAAMRRAVTQSGNYVADKATQPKKVTFTNGRVVRAVGEGAFLDVGPAGA